MQTSIKVQALALLVLGSLTGYVAATMDAQLIARADSPRTDLVRTSARPDKSEEVSCNASNLDRGPLLALAARNEAVAAERELEGRLLGTARTRHAAGLG
jgi:hypothetical protein